MILLGLGLVAACGFVVTGGLSNSEDEPVSAVMPYPRTLKPLPVPEVRIGQGPWQDPLPAEAVPPLPSPLKRPPVQVPKFAEGLTCNDVVVPNVPRNDPSRMHRVCKTG